MLKGNPKGRSAALGARRAWHRACVLGVSALLVVGYLQWMRRSGETIEEELERELQMLATVTSNAIHLHGRTSAMEGIQQTYELEDEHPLRPPFNVCTAHRGIQYAGTVVKELSNVLSPGACCLACSENSRHEGCNSWAYCADEKRCKQQFGTCVLRLVPNPTAPYIQKVGPEVGWTSGIVELAPGLSFASRGIRLVEAPTMWLGLRQGPLTLEVVAPKGEPAFSFTAPFDLFALNSTEGGFHHVGDITLRVRPAIDKGATYQKLSTVPDVKWGAHQPAPADARPLSGEPEGTAARGARAFGYADLSPQLPQTSPVRITRWLEVPQDTAGEKADRQPGMLLQEEVRLYWNITHTGSGSLQLGSLALSMPFDQWFADHRALEHVAVQCSFVEAYVGAGLGYLQVTRANGAGPTLLVLPAPGTNTSFEAWRRVLDTDKAVPGFGFEGHHELLVHSEAWATNEWRAAQQWNEPTSRELGPGESVLYGVRLVLAHGPEAVDAALLAAGHPVVVGVPGLVLHADMRESRLFITTPPSLVFKGAVPHPPGSLLLDAVHAPPAAEGATTHAFRVRLKPTGEHEMNAADAVAGGDSPSEDGGDTSGRTGAKKRRKARAVQPQRFEAGWDSDPTLWQGCQPYDHVNPNAVDGNPCPAYVGRIRLTLMFAPRAALLSVYGPSEVAAQPVVNQTVQLLGLPPARALVRAYAARSARPVAEGGGWLPVEAKDPWKRSPAFMGFDADRDGSLMHDLRVYMAGLSDEAGASQPLAVAMKQLGGPSADQVAKLEAYVLETLYAPLHGNPREYIQDHKTHAVRASLYFNGSDEAHTIKDCVGRGQFWQICWTEARSNETWRAYNYPHVAAVYWSLYHLARFGPPNLVTRQTWDWYLRQAVQTYLAMWKFGRGYGRWGLMVGSVFTAITRDVEDEGWGEEALLMTSVTKERLAFWNSLTFPYGSEMSWDNTGHEEIYSWLDYNNDTVGTEATARAVLAYVGVSPHWALAGSARRWWDFFINGKTNIGNERVHHHYAGALNAAVLTRHFMRNPRRLMLLRAGVAGTMGSLTNIRPGGIPSMGLHGDPSLLRLDADSADWGIGFYGHVAHAASHLACDPHLGWLCFNCDMVRSDPPLSRLYRSTGGAYGPCSVGATHAVEFEPKDAFRARVFIAPAALYLTIDSAWVGSVRWDVRGRRLEVQLLPHDLTDGALPDSPEAAAASRVKAAGERTARLLVERTATQGTMVAVAGQLSVQGCSGGSGEDGAAAACTHAHLCHTNRPHTTCAALKMTEQGTRAVIKW